MLLENRLHACLVELQWLALIRLAQAFEQGVELQPGHLLAQAFTQAGTQAVGQVVIIGGGRSAVGMRERRQQVQAEDKITRHGQFLLQ
ncbi:hypothetical protein D9M71_728840 [compost metagenome]